MKAHILLVEDDTSMRDIIAQALTHENYQVTQAADGRAAIDLLTSARASDHPYEVVITDIVMNDIDGIEVMNCARSQPYEPEVMLLTGHASLDTAIAAVRAGAFDYLQKPCRIIRLLERVAAAIERRRSRHRQTEEARALQRIVEVIKHIEPSEESDGDLLINMAAAMRTSLTSDKQEADTRQHHPPHAEENEERYLRVGELSIDTFRHEVWFVNDRLHITPTEYTILSYLAAIPGRVANYASIAAHSHGDSIDETEAHELLRWHVRNLRNKFDRRYLVSVRGVGYMLIDPNEEEKEETDTP